MLTGFSATAFGATIKIAASKTRNDINPIFFIPTSFFKLISDHQQR
jgi:hypothetical protein